MKKIIIFILLISINAGFSQNKVLLHVRALLNINYGTVNFTFSDNSGSSLYFSNGDAGSSTAKIYDINASQFPLTLSLNINYTSGPNSGCSTTKTVIYTYNDYFNGKQIYLAGCSPNEIFLYSDYNDKLSAGASTKGVCESIPCNQAYSTDGINWNTVSGTVTDIIPKDLPSVGPDYRNNLFVKSTFTINSLYTYASGNYVALPSVTMQLKTRTYNIIGCSPKLVTNPPNASPAICFGTATGSVNLKFQTNIDPSQKLLFNLYEGTIFRQHKFAKYSDIINNQFIWKDLAKGTYTIKYQAQADIDPTTQVPSSVVATLPFTIGSQPLLSFKTETIQPLCNTDKGSIKIEATGGTAPYKYSSVSLGTSGGFNPSITIYATAGEHDINVTDYYNCVINSQKITINKTPAAIAITGSVTNETSPNAKNGKITLDPALAESPDYDLVCNNGTIPMSQLNALQAGTYLITSTNNLQCTNASATFLVREEITCTVTKTNLNCFGANDGTITLNIKGGSGNYSISWKDSSNNTYNPVSSITTDNNTYKYIASGLEPNTYTFTIKDNDIPSSSVISLPLKEYTDSATIFQPVKAFSVADAIINQPAPGIDNGSILINASYGYGNYTYSWTRDGTIFTPPLPQSPDYPKGLGNGQYYVTVTDKNPTDPNGIGCSIIKGPFDLKALNVIITPPAPITCQGSTTSLTATASGGNGLIKLVWYELTVANPVDGEELENSSLNAIKAGTYKVTATDGDNNFVSKIINIPDSTNPVIKATTTHTLVTCFNGSDGTANIKILNPSANITYTFKWYHAADPLVEIKTNISSTENESTLSLIPAGTYKVIASDGFCTEPFSITIDDVTPIIITEEAGGFKDLKCFGDKNGSIAISVAGGTGPYTYIWKRNNIPIKVNNDLNPSLLEEGTYSVEVHTNYDENNPKKCFSTSQDFVINPPSPITFTHTTTDISCKNSSDGTIQLDIKGGTVKNNGDGKPIYKISSNAQAFGAEIDIPNQKLTHLGAGIWDITVSDDNDCIIATQKIKIDEPLTPFAFGPEKITNVTGNTLFNGSIQLNNTGGWGNYSYKWYTGVTVDNNALIPNEESSLLEGKPAGIYTVVATDKKNKDNPGCSLPPFSFEIKQPEVLKLDVIATNTMCNGGQGSIIATAEGGAEIEQQQSQRIYTYELFLNAVSKQIIVGNTANFTGLGIGQYTVVAKDSKGNISTSGNTNYKNDLITSTGFVDLTEPTPILVKEETLGIKKSLFCFDDKDGILFVSVSGGTPFATGARYNYVWKKLNTVTLVYETIGTNDPKQSKLSDGTYSVEVHDANYEPGSPLACIGILENIIITKPEKLAFTHTKENVSCLGESNGTIKLNVIGGTKPYTIYSNGGTIDNQNGTVSGLSAGTYTIKVTDGNLCTTEEQTIIISEPVNSVYIKNENITPTTGFGLAKGKIAVTAAGGTTPYSYQWKNNLGLVVGTDSPTLNNVPAGTYSLLITDSKGCPFSETYTVQEPSKPVLTATPTQSKCNGLLGSLEVVADGGAAYNQIQSDRIYTYKLKNKTSGISTSISGNTANFTNVEDGDYSVTATDISGVDSNIIDVQFIQPSPILVTLISKSNVRCFGDQDGAIAISVSGGTPLLLPNGTTEYKYQWKKKNTATNNYENFTPTSLNSLSQGIYAVEVRDFNYNVNDASHCIGVLENIEITQPANFGFDINKIKYNNPSANGNDGTLHFEIIEGVSNYEYKFYTKDINGNENIITTIPNSPLKSVDFTGLSKDHYYISAEDKTGCIKYANFDFRDNPLTISISQTQNITCRDANNGVLTIATEGGHGFKTIFWYLDNVLLSTYTLSTQKDLSLLNVKPGNYFAVIQDSDKVEVTSAVITVIEPQPVTFSMTPEPVKCIGDSNGKIALTASGGNGNFRYRYFSKNILIKDWQNFSNGVNTTISDLAEGEYTIEVQDTQECTSQNAVIKVTSPTALTISNITYVPATGKGLSNGSVSITAQGANGVYSYSWFKSDNTSINQITNTAGNLPAGKYYVIITDAKSCSLTSSLLEITEPPLLETSIAVQNAISCNGDTNGSLKPTSTGGFLNPGDSYTYKWYEAGTNEQLVSTTILDKIGKGSYYVIVRDSNGNEATSTALIVTEPAILNNTITSDYTLCGDANNWTINAIPSGGTAPYTYNWNNGIKTASIQNVPPANYWVKVTDSHGCNITQNITITAPVHLAASENITIPTCYGGSDATIEITSSGGKAPYTYLWNTGEKSNKLQNASAGVYSLAVTDSKGCIINHDYTIVNPPKDVINLGEDVTLCFDQTLTINAAINDDKATYLWKSDKGFSSNEPMITISQPATYTVIVTNKLGCEASDTIKISSQNTAISAEFAVSSQVFKNEKIVIVDISNPIADEIEWILPANATVVTKNKDYAEISFSQIGQYEITLNTKKGNCTAFQTKQIIVTEGEFEENNPDEAEIEKKFDLKIYPNPSKGIFTVDVTLDKVMPAHVKVYNLNNNLLIDSKSQDGKDNYLFNFTLSGLPAGLYFVLFESQQGSKLRKIIIQ